MRIQTGVVILAMLTAIIGSPIVSVCQKYEILYMQYDQVMDTTTHEIPPFYSNPDTLAKWTLTYVAGRGLLRQTDDSKYERKRYYLNKQTQKFDDFTFYNMSMKDVYYNDYKRKQTFRINYFFDVKYVIEDSLLQFEWIFYDDTKTILGYRCKRAKARYPLDKNLLFDVWYSEEIPINAGPMDLNGLAGLILQVDRNGEPFYKALSLRHLADEEALDIEKPLDSQKAITFTEYQKVRFGVPFENHNQRPPIKKDSN